MPRFPSRLRLVVAVALLLPASFVTACDNSTPTASTPAAPYSQTDVRVGSGTEASTGRRVSVHYSGWIYDPRQAEGKGRQFDSSVGREPYVFVLGARTVIQGFEQGVPGMRVGGVRRLVLPPDMAYGSNGVGGAIPPYATLVFDVELVAVE